MKTRHQRLQTRVTTVREELQSFLEDDDDMMKMCLTHKKEQEQNQAELQRAGGALLTTAHVYWSLQYRADCVASSY